MALYLPYCVYLRTTNSMKKIWLTFIAVTITGTLLSQTLSSDETQLYKQLMAYRVKVGLPKIPISKALNVVAQTHVRDLYTNKPDQGGCNLHSWSANGKWKPICYTPDHANAKGMWEKPGELTDYKGYGYEIAYWHSAAATPSDAVDGWKKSTGHNELIVNKGIWKTTKWKAIGIGIYKNYAVVWFGEDADK